MGHRVRHIGQEYPSNNSTEQVTMSSIASPELWDAMTASQETAQCDSMDLDLSLLDAASSKAGHDDDKVHDVSEDDRPRLSQLLGSARPSPAQAVCKNSKVCQDQYCFLSISVLFSTQLIFFSCVGELRCLHHHQ